MGVRLGNPTERRATSEAIEEVYRSRFHAFLKVAASVAGERHAADAVHDGFARALRHRRSFRGESPLEAWLWRLVLNAAIDARGDDAAGTLDDPSALEDRQPVGDETDDESDLIRNAIAKLPPRQRLAVWLRYYMDLDYEAIGEILLIKPGTVAATLHGARSAIRRELEEARCKII
jgi:RNA polymerase sigma-70 factor, ECF subfamily